ncbi:MAG: DnaJ domain-containing protein [candidate division WWE3 bacterium]|nr:DnaJ domain-containing protein [candidate division WWE3 bacterium]
MSTKRDYYEVLGVPKGSSEDDLKKAFREAARKHHPDIDKTAGAEERFKEINEAYQVLSNPEKRKAYDQFGHDAFGAGTGAGAGNGGNPFAGGGPFSYTYSTNGEGIDLGDLFGQGGMGDIFESFFGGGYGRSRKGRDKHYQIGINFLAAAYGDEQDINFEGKKLKIKIPAGIYDGAQMKFTGEGEAGPAGTPAGDLLLTIRVVPDARFSRERDDLYTLKTISFTTAALGGEVEVPALSDRKEVGVENIKLKIPSGTQFGTDFRVKGRGLTHLHGRGRGDLFVRILVEIPKKLSRDEKRILEELQKQTH